MSLWDTETLPTRCITCASAPRSCQKISTRPCGPAAVMCSAAASMAACSAAMVLDAAPGLYCLGFGALAKRSVKVISGMEYLIRGRVYTGGHGGQSLYRVTESSNLTDESIFLDASHIPHI